MSGSKGDPSFKGERVVNVTVNNNNGSGITSISSSPIIEPGNRPLIPTATSTTASTMASTTAALVQAYLTLNNITRSSGNNNIRNTSNSCVPNIELLTPDSSVSLAPIRNEVKCEFYVKVINPDKKKEFNTYVLRDVTKDKISTPQKLRKELKNQFGDTLISSISWISLWVI